MILGIDPGLDGAIACYDLRAQALFMKDMPTISIKGRKKTTRTLDLSLLLCELRGYHAPIEHAYVELVHAMPKQGVTSSFNFGFGYGALLACLTAAGIPFTQVTPQRWKARLAVPADKDAARLRASQLMPKHAHLWPLKKHDGRAEAALIALYGSTQDGGVLA